MKPKNPLYVVKGKDVQEASSVVDLVIKKFNLEPLIQILQNILRMLLEQVQTFQSYLIVKAYVDQVLETVMTLGQKFGRA